MRLANRLLVIGALALFAVVLTRTAWVCDDAYITFRTVDNLLHGFGPRWNIDERAQAYTHPLWMLMLAVVELVTREPYFTSIGLSLLLSLAAAAIVAFRLARTSWQAVAAVLVLASVRSFVDFSTSGLENAASHALIAWYLAAIGASRSEKAKSTPMAVVLPIAIASLVLVNRLDLVLLIGPSLAVYLTQLRPARSIRILAWGALPIFAWELFSLIYYGFLVPNTAFAKLSTGISERELVAQGFRYLQESALHDPLTLTVIAVSVAVGLAGTVQARAMAIGQLLYLGYVVWVGGDFMSGRFLAASLFVGVAQLAAAPLVIAGAWRIVPAAAALAIGLCSTAPPVLSGRMFGHRDDYEEYYGITDERRFYFPRTGLLRTWEPLGPPELIDANLAAAMRAAGQRVATRETIGMFGVAAGRDFHVIDVYALADPLLARLPASGRWRIGHFRRELPPGYVATLRSGTNQIVDAGLATYYDALSLITRGPLFSGRRLGAIVSMNLGREDHRLDVYRASLPPAQ